MLYLRHVTLSNFMLALGISALIIALIGLFIFIQDQREQSAITAADVFTAVSQGDMTRVIACLKAKPELANARDKDGNTPLHIAAKRNMADTTVLLLKMGSDPSLKNSQGKIAEEISREKAGGK